MGDLRKEGALLSGALCSGVVVRLTVAGTSMCPCLLPGDQIDVGSLEGGASRGDLVVRMDGQSPVVHRVIRLRMVGHEQRVVTKGDNARPIDSECTGKELLGRVFRLQRGDRVCCLNVGPIRHMANGLGALSWAQLRWGIFVSSEGRTNRFLWRVGAGMIGLGLKMLHRGVRWLQGSLIRCWLRPVGRRVTPPKG